MEKPTINYKKKLILLSILFSAFALGACSQNTVKPDDGKGAVGSGTQMGTIDGSVDTSNTRGDYLPGANNDPSNSNDITLAGLNDQNNLLSKRVIYFDYNQASILPEYIILINTHAKLAAKYPELKMRLEGHADERGSREYNVALSEQRSQSVKRIMGIQGARSGQIKTIGYGEEIPIVMGHNKDSWQQNRRVEIKYDNY